MSKTETVYDLERALWSLEAAIEQDGGTEEDMEDLADLRRRLAEAQGRARRNMTDQDREMAMEVGMGHGIDAYNDYMGY